MRDIIVSRKSNMDKVMRFAVDQLEKNDKVSIRASVEQGSRLRELVETLCASMGCTIDKLEHGHIKDCGQHTKIIRYSLLANDLEFTKDLGRL